MSDRGVVLPETGGQRSSTRFGREVVAEALRGVDPHGADLVLGVTDWRTEYPRAFRRLTQAAGSTPSAEVGIAEAGLAAIGHRMRFVADDGAESALADHLSAEGETGGFITEVIREPRPCTPELVIPYRGRELRGEEITAQAADWARRGIVEPEVVDALTAVVAHPEWLSLPGRTVIVLGARSEMGPLLPLLSWGARVAAVGRPGAEAWRRLITETADLPGGLAVIARPGVGPVEERAGAELLTDVAGVAAWATGVEGAPVLGNYLYADGVLNLRLSAAADAVAAHLLDARPDAALAYLGTPSDSFVVPEEAVAASRRARSQRRGAAVVSTLSVVTRGRLFAPAYPDGSRIADATVDRQGPNYLLAKRIQRWRAAVAAARGRLVSMLVAPPARTWSVVKNRALATAFDGAHLVGLEIFEPDTARALMAALLVHDLHTPVTPETSHAVHGGFWRIPDDPRTALGLAAGAGLVRSMARDAVSLSRRARRTPQ